MPHSSGGGSSGGGSHGGSSGHSGSGGSSSPRWGSSYYAGSHRYVYYKNNQPQYYFSDKPDTIEQAKEILSGSTINQASEKKITKKRLSE